jgi:hypothetical protein
MKKLIHFAVCAILCAGCATSTKLKVEDNGDVFTINQVPFTGSRENLIDLFNDPKVDTLAKLPQGVILWRLPLPASFLYKKCDEVFVQNDDLYWQSLNLYMDCKSYTITLIEMPDRKTIRISLQGKEKNTVLTFIKNENGRWVKRID